MTLGNLGLRLTKNTISQFQTLVTPNPSNGNNKKAALIWPPGNRYRMASIARPALLRQAAAAASRMSVASSRAGPALASRAAMQHGIRQSMAANTARVTSFHTTSRRPILPPLARKFCPASPRQDVFSVLTNPAERVEGGGMC